MCSKNHTPSNLSMSLSIRQEIQRFESVHPSIYAIYDLIEMIHDPLLAQQIRDHVVSIEDSFVNSQEWTVARGVTELRVGVVGSPCSGKSALVHRYLTGTFMQEESPEGGRFKKEVVIDGHSYLLLIRDEGGSPEMQFTAWVDAVIFVFSLENEYSFTTVLNYFNKMSHYRNPADIPVILVGTQDGISEGSPRVVDETRARKMANELRRCSYYETCATYGLNVERVFQDACQKIVGSRLSSSSQCLSSGSRPATPQPAPVSPTHHNHASFMYKDSLPRGHGTLSTSSNQLHRNAQSFDASSNSSGISSTHVVEVHSTNGSDTSSKWTNSSQGLITENNNIKFTAPQSLDNLQPYRDVKDLPTPVSTPTTTRKTRRRSTLFTPSKKGDDRFKNGELGSGRAIPLKQGYLYKKSSKALNKEWKKKYVTLCDDGKLTYHPSLHDYMEDVNGKEISLQYVTVKVPGQKPRGSRSIITTMPNYHSLNGELNDDIGRLSIGYNNTRESKACTRVTDKALLSAFEIMKEPTGAHSGKYTLQVLGSDEASGESKAETPHVKKRHRRIKSSSLKNGDDGEGEPVNCYELTIVSLAGKRWRFEVCGGAGPEERDAWVTAIEQQIFNALQARSPGPAPAALRSVAGNTHCVDCNAKDPDWASMNLGVLICIECSGIHRNLGSHMSRVRSIDLDEWPLSHLCVMVSLGNACANRFWEADLKGHTKPMPTSTREEKERWIRLKYLRRAFTPTDSCENDLPTTSLRIACTKGEVGKVARLLASCDLNVNDKSAALRAACAAGQLAAAQLLLWHNANASQLDSDERNSLFYARAAANHLRSIPLRPMAHLQLTCATHEPSPPDCCPLHDQLTAQNTADELVKLLQGLSQTSRNGSEASMAVDYMSSQSNSSSGRPSLGTCLSLSNGKCSSGSIV